MEGGHDSEVREVGGRLGTTAGLVARACGGHNVADDSDWRSIYEAALSSGKPVGDLLRTVERLGFIRSR